MGGSRSETFFEILAFLYGKPKHFMSFKKPDNWINRNGKIEVSIQRRRFDPPPLQQQTKFSFILFPLRPKKVSNLFRQRTISHIQKRGKKREGNFFFRKWIGGWGAEANSAIARGRGDAGSGLVIRALGRNNFRPTTPLPYISTSLGEKMRTWGVYLLRLPYLCGRGECVCVWPRGGGVWRGKGGWKRSRKGRRIHWKSIGGKHGNIGFFVSRSIWLLLLPLGRGERYFHIKIGSLVRFFEGKGGYFRNRECGSSGFFAKKEIRDGFW